MHVSALPRSNSIDLLKSNGEGIGPGPLVIPSLVNQGLQMTVRQPDEDHCYFCDVTTAADNIRYLHQAAAPAPPVALDWTIVSSEGIREGLTMKRSCGL